MTDELEEPKGKVSEGSSLAEDIFGPIDEYICKTLRTALADWEKSKKNSYLINKLAGDWWDGLWKKLKELCGTSAQFTFYPEYVMLNILKAYLKEKLNIKFDPERYPKSKDLYEFCGDWDHYKIKIGRTISYEEYNFKKVINGKSKKLKPDISIIKEKKDDKSGQVIAVINVKSYADIRSIRTEIQELTDLDNSIAPKPRVIAIVHLGELRGVRVYEEVGKFLEKGRTYCVVPKKKKNDDDKNYDLKVTSLEGLLEKVKEYICSNTG